MRDRLPPPPTLPRVLRTQGREHPIQNADAIGSYLRGRVPTRERLMDVLVIDVGGTHVKILATGQDTPREFPSGPKLTAKAMVARVKRLAAKWKYDAVSIGYPGPVLRNRPVAEPHNLGRGWVGFDFEARSVAPSRSSTMLPCRRWATTRAGRCCSLGRHGTGLDAGRGQDCRTHGARPPALQEGTYEDYVGARASERIGTKKWRQNVADVVGRLMAALEPEDVVLGGGNVKKLKELPPGRRAGETPTRSSAGSVCGSTRASRAPPVQKPFVVGLASAMASTR